MEYSIWEPSKSRWSVLERERCRDSAAFGSPEVIKWACNRKPLLPFIRWNADHIVIQLPRPKTTPFSVDGWFMPTRNLQISIDALSTKLRDFFSDACRVLCTKDVFARI